MWKIHRYYLREIGVNCVMTFLVLFGIAMISLLYKAIGLVRGGDLVDAALTTVLLAADAIPHLLTVSFLFATVLAFARASQDREITAVRSAGISPRVPLVSALLIGLVCSLAAAVSNHYVIPWAHYNKYRVVVDIYKNAVRTLIRDQDRISLGGGSMVWRDRDDRGGYKDVLIFCDQTGLAKQMGVDLGKTGTLVRAESASFHEQRDQHRISLRLKNVRVPATDIFLGDFELSIDVREIAQRRQRVERDKDLTSDKLLAEVDRGVRSDVGMLKAEYLVHRRACFALMPFLLAPIGFCIGVLSRERGRVLALSYCIVPLALFYLTDFLGENLLLRMPTAHGDLIGWLPAVVIILAATPFCWRLLKV